MEPSQLAPVAHPAAPIFFRGGLRWGDRGGNEPSLGYLGGWSQKKPGAGSARYQPHMLASAPQGRVGLEGAVKAAPAKSVRPDPAFAQPLRYLDLGPLNRRVALQDQSERSDRGVHAN